jgi:hypothetical protein
METKGRRSLRASGPTEAPVGPVKPTEAPAPDTQPGGTEPPIPAELLAEAAKPIETAVNIVTASAAAAGSKPSIDPVPPPAKSATLDDLGTYGDAAVAALAQSQAALARGLEALSAEMAGLALSGMNMVARTANRLLAVKTLADAIEVNAGFTCSSFDALVGGSAKLSEIGVKLAAETCQPLLTQLDRSWSKAARLGG